MFAALQVSLVSWRGVVVVELCCCIPAGGRVARGSMEKMCTVNRIGVTLDVIHGNTLELQRSYTLIFIAIVGYGL